MTTEMPIPGFPSYLANTDGEVISLYYGKRRVMKTSVVKGKLQVTVRDADLHRTGLPVASLIASAFHGDRKGTVRFRDCDTLNCRPANLEWNDDCVTSLTEEMRPVPGYENLFACSAGRVYSAAGKSRDGLLRPLQVSLSVKGYERVCVNRDGKSTTVPVHRAVALAFHGGPPPDKPLVRHLNGLKRDNRPMNLRWGDSSENALDLHHHTAIHGVRSLHGIVSTDHLTGEFGYTEEVISLIVNCEDINEVLVRENFEKLVGEINGC